MPLNAVTVAKLLNLANRIIEQYGVEFVALVRETVVVAGPPPTPVPLPVPPVEPLPADFNEAFYLAANPDVVPYVGVGKAYATGGAHYLLWGRMEGRPYKRVGPATPPPPPVDSQWNPKAAYSSSMAMLADITGNNFPQAVNLDGRNVKEGFGPAVNYYQWADGTVRTEDSGQTSLPLPPVDLPPGETLL